MGKVPEESFFELKSSISSELCYLLKIIYKEYKIHIHKNNTINATKKSPIIQKNSLQLMGGLSIGTFLNFVVWQHQTSYRPEILTVY